MHILSLFIMLALTIFLTAYISHPLHSKEHDLDQLITREVERIKKDAKTTEQSVCRRCGNKLEASDRFCSQCGHPVEEK